MGDAEESGRNGEMFIRLTLISNDIEYSKFKIVAYKE